MAGEREQAQNEETPEYGDELPQSEGQTAPTGLAIDAEAGLVFVPDIGWMDVAGFAHLYLNEPEKLPPSFDHQAVHALLQEHHE